MGSIPGSGRSPGGGNGNSLQYSCLENPTDRGALQAIVHGVAKSWTQPSTRAHTHTLKLPLKFTVISDFCRLFGVLVVLELDCPANT